MSIGEIAFARAKEHGIAKLSCGAATYFSVSVPNFEFQRTPSGATE